MNFLYDMGLREAKQIVAAAQFARVVLHELAAKIGLGQLVCLYHRAHCPVEHKDALGEETVQVDGALGGGMGHAQSAIVMGCGEMF